ncbi:hypothetical protein B0T45_09250 [Chromobacterium haemolyticum]|uniref:Uncharacterized protein n=2 Tax=Chromobacterium haemolyticum TaxID=394935 RepID=A0A1W0D1X1_9NEIS|nr:hypothetical protein B0T45_09250 [Chromobacterium haemolyticum]
MDDRDELVRQAKAALKRVEARKAKRTMDAKQTASQILAAMDSKLKRGQKVSMDEIIPVLRILDKQADKFVAKAQDAKFHVMADTATPEEQTLMQQASMEAALGNTRKATLLRQQAYDSAQQRVQDMQRATAQDARLAQLEKYKANGLLGNSERNELQQLRAIKELNREETAVDVYLHNSN